MGSNWSASPRLNRVGSVQMKRDASPSCGDRAQENTVRIDRFDSHPRAPFLPLSRMRVNVDAEIRITKQFEDVKWDAFLADWTLPDLKALIDRLALESENTDPFYLGTTPSIAWRWCHCEGHNKDFRAHMYRYRYIYPLAFDRGMVVAEEMLLEWVRETPALFSRSCSSWPYRSGPLAVDAPAFLYICLGNSLVLPP